MCEINLKITYQESMPVLRVEKMSLVVHVVEASLDCKRLLNVLGELFVESLIQVKETHGEFKPGGEFLELPSD
jgi:hypothetical protein